MSTMVRQIGVQAFNQLLVRKNFSSWRRGMQIQYNVTRIDEWCTKHDVSEASLHLEPLMQAAKLLQLNKSTREDVEIMVDVCFLLTMGQINKILSLFTHAEFESPVSPEVRQIIASRYVT